MAVQCPFCKRDYDITLFEFGREVTCVCGNIVSFEHEEIRDKLLTRNNRGGFMAKMSFKVDSVYCYDCVTALKKFIGSLEGIQSIEMEGEEMVDISYDPSVISEEKLRQIIMDSVEKLGFRIIM